ncbi:hypothetical protein V1264_010573 [Littorina saxatilis]|uniref:Endonuclease n=1 Tax=Littorina saxatilis TaxID=31220 RepID=A0AAN9APT9_9CAEN
MCINDVMVSFQLDSGATTNCLSESVYKTVTKDKQLRHVKKTDRRLLMYNGSEVRPAGETILRVVNPKNKEEYRVRFYIVREKTRPILGFRALQYMKLMTVNVENIAVATDRHDDKHVLTEFHDVFEGELGTLEGELHLVTDPKVPPVKLPCRKWPAPVKQQVKEELDRLLELGVIAPVNTPTDWISSLVVTMKPNGKARLCIDPRPLNKAIKRNHYPMRTIDDVLEELQGAQYFTHLDARNGFWHVVLDEESSLLTTFETPFGKYRWRRLPFGVSASPEEFQRRMDEALRDLPGVFAVHDDIIIWGKDEDGKSASEVHDRNVKQLLQRCREKGIKLNSDKVEYKKTEISYLGHVISTEGVKADPKKIDAVKKLKTPEDKAAVQRLLGMVGYLQKFAPRLSEIATPLRQLVKKNVHFRWDEQVHGKALQEIKEVLSQPPVLKFFNPKAEKVVLQCDASEFGLGACLMADGHPVQYASRALTETERNYAQIEKEMLAIVFGLERFERYVYGRHVEVESDHKPLIPIHKKSLLSAPKRLQRMLLRTQKYDYTVVYKKGTEMYIADTLSRAVESSGTGGDRTRREEIFQSELEKEIETVNMTSHIAVTEERLTELQEETRRDQDLGLLMKIVQTGWPEERRNVPVKLQDYFPFREEISLQNGLLFKGERIVVPENMRTKVMSLIHISHTGLQGCLRRAREVVYWPGMNKDMEQLIGQCEACQTYQRNQTKEPMISQPIPDLPWQFVGVDLLELNGRDYVVTVDYYSDFFEVDRIQNKTGKEVINKMKAHFARYGVPERVISDNGPPFNSEEFAAFARSFGFEHVTSSPGYPQSNGKAENAVKAAKNLMRKTSETKTDPYLALLELRNIPSEKMKTSPSQRLFGRRTRTAVPSAKSLLKPETCRDVRNKLMEKKEKQTSYYNRGAVELETLKPGQVVRFKAPRSNRWVKATVQNQVDVRSYKIRTEDGRMYRRNRKQIRSTSSSDMTAPVQGGQQLYRHLIDKSQEKNDSDTRLEQRQTRQQDQQKETQSQTPVTEENRDAEQSDKVKDDQTYTRSGRVVRKPAYLNDYKVG